MMFPDESLGGSPAPDTALPAAPAPSPAPAPESAPAPSDAPPTQAQVNAPMKPATPEMSLREKIQKKAEEVASRRPKDPVTGKFLGKPGEPQAPLPAAEKPLIPGQRAPDPASPSTFVPNYKVKIMETERDIPELLRPLMKDAESAKAVKEIMEKAYGLDYVKPKLDEARTQLTQVSTQHSAVMRQIGIAQQQFKSGDIDSWLKTLAVPQESILQWVADKLEYSKLPPEQKAFLDERKQANERVMYAEQQASHYQQQHEQSLTQQVQMGLESALAKPEVDVVAKAYDARMGKPGAFRAELNRRGDYYWRTTNKVTPPEQLAQELVQILGPMAPAAQPSPQAPAAPAVQATQAPKPPVIPNISGRSATALPSSVKSIADIRAKYNEAVAARRGG